jgi:DNA-binding transcriptional LysR family regulator
VVTPLLAELAAQHEGLMVEVLTGTRTLELGRLEADLALRFTRPRAGELVVRRVASLETCVLVRHDRLQLAEAGALDWIIADPELGDSPEGDFLRARLGTPARWKTNDYMLQVEWLRAGLGAAVVPRVLMQRFPELVEHRLDWPQPPTLELFLATPRSLRALARVSAVWDALEVGLPRVLSLQL